MRAKPFIVFSCALFILTAATFMHPASAQGRQRFRLDAGWRFLRGDLNDGATGIPIARWRWKAMEGGTDAAANAQASATQMAAPDLDVSGPGWQDAAPGQDTFGGRIGFTWYRATLDAMPGPHRVLHFQSVDDNATVYLNGQKLIHHAGWDDAFEVPLDAAWRTDGPNVVAVLVENTAGQGGIGETRLQAVTNVVPAAARPGFDDRAWRMLHLPHDFVVEGTFDQKSDGGHGFLPKDAGWYRKSFPVSRALRGRRLWLDFDGIFRNSSIYLNGQLLGQHPSGYIGAHFDITNAVNYGGANVLAVRTDARASEGWWYEGGGIYRHVWLSVADSLHVVPSGVFVSPVTSETGPNAFATADVTIKTTVANDGAGMGAGQLVSRIVSPAGQVVSTLAMPLSLAAAKQGEIVQHARLLRPALWSIETPNLYHLVTTIERGGKVLDNVATNFGVRTIRFDPNGGFFLNGKSVKLKGTCNHQDFAGVGIAMPDSLLEWRIRKLKEMGSNAYRTSHNPVATELLDACDRLGMVVMDENRHLGDTYGAKTNPGTPTTDLGDLQDMVLRDRNHPSVVMWSMCNEEPLQGTDEGARIFSAMKAVTNQLDGTRPVTCAMNGGQGSGISLVEDLVGFNYSPGSYDGYHKAHPEQPLYGSETASALSDRGIYANDEKRAYVSAYDLNHPAWGQTAEEAWRPLAERPFMAGGFVWTGFDYRGEPTPYWWPNVNSHFGIMDMCGFPKDSYYYYLAWWGDKPMAHILPHWNWPGQEGQPIDVWVHSNCERVELLLNGQSLGSKNMTPFTHLEWKVPYAPGRLEARGYNGTILAASDVVTTTGAPARLRLTPDRVGMKADGEDVVMVAVDVLDAQGRIVPTANNLVSFNVRGPGMVAGVGNGDASSHEPDRASQRSAFNGRCMVIVQSGPNPGPLVLTATAPGLAGSSVNLNVRALGAGDAREWR